MNPVNDIVCSLLETPFLKRNDEDKRDLFQQGRPTVKFKTVANRDCRNPSRRGCNFKESWFDEYKWLCCSYTLQKLYCWPCLLFNPPHSNLTQDGVDYLNIEKFFCLHAATVEHIKCELMLKKFEREQSNLFNALEEHSKLIKERFNEDVRLNRLFLKVVIKALLYLVKQDLIFVKKNSDSNFNELLVQLINECSFEIQVHYEKNKNVFTNYLKTLQYELIECISDYINDHVKSEINDANCFSIQVDNTIDASNQISKYSLIVRFMSSEVKLVERFLGFFNMNDNKSSEALYEVLDNTLEQFNYQPKLVGQCYDGASLMPEELSKFHKKVKFDAVQAIFVNSFEHPLNDILQQSISNIPKCRIFFATLGEMALFFHSSSNRSYAITSITTKGIPDSKILQWSSVSSLLSIIIEDWDKLTQVFKVMMNSTKSDKVTVHLAKGFLNDMNNFEFIFLALAFNDIFACTHTLFQIILENPFNIGCHLIHIKKTREILRQKGYATFIKLFDKANKIAKVNMSKHEYAAISKDATQKAYKHLFLKIANLILIEIDIRFLDYEVLEFVSLVDTTQFQNFSLHFPNKTFESLLVLYRKIFPYDLKMASAKKFKNELIFLYSNKELWNISFQKLLLILQSDKDILPESYKLAFLVATIPFMPVEKESTCFKRIKTYLKSTAIEKKCTSLENIFIQKDVLLMLMQDEKFYDEIIDRFAAKEKQLELVFKP